MIRNKKLLSICLVWIIGFAVASAELVFSRAIPFKYGDQTLYDCRETFDEYWGRVYTLVIFVLTFALPLSILAFVYTTIGLRIWRNGIPGNPDKQRDENRENRKDKVNTMFFLQTVTFYFMLVHLLIILR